MLEIKSYGFTVSIKLRTPEVQNQIVAFQVSTLFFKC
jgi:hypothetical protein